MLRRFWYIAWTSRERSAESYSSHLASTSFNVIGLPATSATTWSGFDGADATWAAAVGSFEHAPENVMAASRKAPAQIGG